MEFSYDYFVDCLIQGDQRIFAYQDKIIVVQSSKKFVQFIVERYGKRLIDLRCETPQLLLDNARIDGKTLQEIWDELKLE
jgi:hypothetical protein